MSSYITDRGVALRRIKAINTARTKLADDIQTLALTAIFHAHTHGDFDLANALTVAVGNGMKHEALRLYLCEFGPLNPNANKATKGAKPLLYAKSKRLEDAEAIADVIAKASLKKWWDRATERPAEDFSFAAGLHSLLNKLKKAQENGYEPTAEERAGIDALYTAAQNIPKPVRKAAEKVQS